MDAVTPPDATPDATSDTLTFPAGFRWGVATSSYQFEGNCTNSQWYAWEQAGRSKSGSVAGNACDWWERAERDFELAQQLGLKRSRR